jgi:hypothetical protein
MARGDDTKRGSGRSGRRQTWLRILGVALLLAGVASHVLDLRSRSWSIELPLAPLLVSSLLQKTDALPAKPGALQGQNLLLVTLDTTRPDRLGCYGIAESTTPHLDRLASEGVVFTEAIATTSTTLSAHASILTGLYPHRHGARANALYTLGPEQLTLAEILSD